MTYRRRDERWVSRRCCSSHSPILSITGMATDCQTTDSEVMYRFEAFESFKRFNPPPSSSPATAGEERGRGLSDWNFLNNFRL